MASEEDDFAQVNAHSSRELILEDGWEWKRRAMIDINYSISNHDRVSIIDDIKKILETYDVYGHLEASCFSELLKLSTKAARCNKLVHYFIAREIVMKDGGDQTEMWFKIGRKKLRFSRFEYGLVCGLKFGASNFDHNKEYRIRSSYLYKRIFNGCQMSLDELKQSFITKKLGDDPEDYLKVAKILLVYYMLLGFEPSHTLDDWIWVLIEKEEEWEAFPWGSYSYQSLLHFLSNIHTTPRGSKRPAYHIYGFSLAFSAWIYCAIPQLGETCGGVKDRKAIPRILRFGYNSANVNTSDIRGQMFKRLQPGRRERASIYWKSIEEGPFLLQYAPRRSFAAHEPKPAPSQRASRDAFHEHDPSRDAFHEHDQGRDVFYDHASSTQPFYGPIDPVIPWTMSQRQAFFQDFFRGQGSEQTFDQPESSQYYEERSPENWEWNPQFQWGWNPPQNTEPTEDESGHWNSPIRKSTPNEENVWQGTGRTQMWNEENVWKDTGSTQMWNDSVFNTWNQMSAGEYWGVDESMQHRTPSQGTSHIPFVTPIRDITSLSAHSTPVKLDFREVRRRAASAALRSPFLPYDKRFDNWNNFLQSKKLRNVGIGYGVGAEFFTELLKPGELTDAHIDAYMAILHSNPAFASRTLHKTDLVLTSSGFMAAIRKVFEQYHDLEGASQLNKETEQMISNEDLFGLSQYVSGHLPGWHPLKPWYDYNRLVFVAHLDSDHWLTCVVSLPEHLIAFYDSTWHNWTKEIRQSRINFFAPLARILPQLLKYCGYWDCRKELQPKYTEWRIKTVESAGVYKQNDG
ncbi:hypothetical protein C2S52_005323, partial [Perilla frutescens var. hirtella]